MLSARFEAVVLFSPQADFVNLEPDSTTVVLGAAATPTRAFRLRFGAPVVLRRFAVLFAIAIVFVCCVLECTGRYRRLLFVLCCQ